MDNIYLFLILLLVLLAISDLVVGVSNDAVNFLNSAVGSKAAPFKIILLIAGLGVILGAVFSSGMMEIARSGIFNPSKFLFNEVMIIFLAVMLTDVILLDLYNTFGLPTSTTVSMIFELLGASVGVVLYKISGSELNTIGDYLNTSKVLAIISGIFISIIVAFSTGSIIQYFMRLLFTFNYKKTYRYFGAIFGGLAVTAIVYFMLMKGAKGSTFMAGDTLNWIKSNSLKILAINFAFWAILFELFILTTKINIFRIVILAGTFALAMAFAGNDLVNFIGVPLAGIESYNVYSSTGLGDPTSLTMEFLKSPVKTPTLYLVIAGLIMSFTLFLSRKAKTVTETEISLGRQDSGDEKFESSRLARSIVRASIQIGNLFRIFIPPFVRQAASKRLEKSLKKSKNHQNKVSFDLVRASVNLVVSSILIASATSLKLPLSTTYVTFMVAMGSALADGAWDRESAVYRVSGVVTVIGGWFFTAFTAFTVALIVALIISWGGQIAILILSVIVVTLLIRFHLIHKKRDKKKNETELLLKESFTDKKIYAKIFDSSVSYYQLFSEFYFTAINCLVNEKRKKLKKNKKEISIFDQQVEEMNMNLHPFITRFQDKSVDAANMYVQIKGMQVHTIKSLKSLNNAIFDYIDNNHSLKSFQVDDLNTLNNEIKNYFTYNIQMVKTSGYSEIKDPANKYALIIETIGKIRKKTLKHIKNHDISSKNSNLYLRVLNDTENLMFNIPKIFQIEAEMFKLLK